MGGAGRLSVEIGQFVLAGEPLGISAFLLPINAGENVASSRPRFTLSSEKDGSPVDPAPIGFPNQPKRPADDAQNSSLPLRVALGAIALVAIDEVRFSMSANAAASDTYRRLTLFGEVFDKIRSGLRRQAR